MDFILGIFTFIGAFITIILTLSGISVWLDSKLEEVPKKETIMNPLPKVNPNSFADKWARWMSTPISNEDIVGTPEWEKKYQPKI